MQWEKVAIFAFGVVFVSILLTLAFLFPNPTPFQYETSRIVLALAAAGVATLLTGFINLEIPKFIKTGGAFAVFVIVYFYSPAELVIGETRTVESIRSLLAGDWTYDADRQLELALARYPNNPDLHNFSGKARMNLQNYEDAAQSFTKAIEFSDDEQSRFNYLYNRSAALLLARDFQGALSDLEVLQKQTPNDPSLHFNLGLAHSRLKQFDKALSAFNTTLELDQTGSSEYDADVQLQIGISHVLENQDGSKGRQLIARALAHFREAVCTKPELKSVFLGRKRQIDEFYYDDENEILSLATEDVEYAEFIEELKMGRQCWG